MNAYDLFYFWQNETKISQCPVKTNNSAVHYFGCSVVIHHSPKKTLQIHIMEIPFMLWILPESMNLPDLKHSMEINYVNKNYMIVDTQEFVWEFSQP